MSNLSMAYQIRQKNKKKFAKGGAVNKSAKTEHRPMPEEKDKDAKMVAHNDDKKSLPGDKWTDSPTVKQAQKPSITPISRPKMANGIFKVRDRADVDMEERMMSSMPPDGYGRQPPKRYDEDGQDRQGPSVPALKMKMMAEGGMINKAVSMKRSEEDNAEHPEGLEETNSSLGPAEDEYMADHFAQGGEVKPDNRQPQPEADEMEHASIAAAIMAKKRRMYAEGGMVDIMDNGDEDANQYDRRNAEVLKENYDSDMEDVSQPMDSNEMNDPREDETSDPHDRVSAIRSRMKSMRKGK